MFKRFSVVLLCLCCLVALCAVAFADTDGDFTYTVSAGAASVTGYTGSSASVVIPDTLGGNPVTIIAANAFKDNTTLKSVVVPNGVTDLKGRAFYGCTSLTDVSLPDSLTSLATGAFGNCMALTTLRLPPEVDTIGNNALSTDTLIIVESYDGMDTMTYDAVGSMCDCIEYTLCYGDTMITRASSRTGVSMTVPDTLDGHALTSVASGAFPEDVKLIVDLNSAVAQTLCGFGYYVYDPSDLTIGVTLSGGLVTLAAYDGSASTLTVPSFVEAIGENAFLNNSTLTSVALPSSVLSIGAGAFYSTGLEAIDIPSGLTTIYSDSLPASCKPHVTLGSAGSRALSNAGYTFYQPNDDIYGCRYIDGLLYLVLYNGSEDVLKVPEGIEGVAYVSGVYNKMTNVEFPSTLKVIGNEAFKNCSGLTSVTIPSTVEEIGYEAFAGSALRSIRLPDNVQRVGDGAFSYCTQLASATFVVSGKNGVSAIGDNAFYNTALRSVSIPTTTTSIGSAAFASCDKLATVTLPEKGSLNYIGSGAFSGSAITEVTVPGTVERIDGSFANCTSLKKVTLQSGVKVIGDSAFSNCASLQEINIPSGVTTIGNNAFYSDASLTKLALPNTVTSMGTYAFACAGLSGGITLSNKLTTVSANAFEYSSLTSVVIPDSVTSIGSYAFNGCNSLTDVTLSSKLTSIASGAFNDCSRMTWFELPSTMTRLNQCLSGCTSAIVVLPDSITYIDGIALGDVRAVFGSRKNDILKSLNRFGYSDEKTFVYTYIGDDGVEDFTTLRVVDYVGKASEATLSGDVKIINDNAFYYCGQLKKLTLPDKGITKIGNGAFHSRLQVICTKGSDTHKLLVNGGYPVEVDGYPGLYAVSRDGKLYDARYLGNASIIDLPDNIASTDSFGYEDIYDEATGYLIDTIWYDAFPASTIYRTTFTSQTASTLGSAGYAITVAGKEDFGFRRNYFNELHMADDYHLTYDIDMEEWILAYYYGNEKTVIMPDDVHNFYLPWIQAKADVLFKPGTSIKTVCGYTGDLTFVGYEDYAFGVASSSTPIVADGLGYYEGVYVKKYKGSAAKIVIDENFPAAYFLEDAIPANVKIYCKPALSGSFYWMFSNRSFFVEGYDDYELRYSGGTNPINIGSTWGILNSSAYLYKYTGTEKTITIDKDFPVDFAIDGAIPSKI